MLDDGGDQDALEPIAGQSCNIELRVFFTQTPEDNDNLSDNVVRDVERYSLIPYELQRAELQKIAGKSVVTVRFEEDEKLPRDMIISEFGALRRTFLAIQKHPAQHRACRALQHASKIELFDPGTKLLLDRSNTLFVTLSFVSSFSRPDTCVNLIAYLETTSQF